jgi:hypothetical protein
MRGGSGSEVDDVAERVQAGDGEGGHLNSRDAAAIEWRGRRSRARVSPAWRSGSADLPLLVVLRMASARDRPATFPAHHRRTPVADRQRHPRSVHVVHVGAQPAGRDAAQRPADQRRLRPHLLPQLTLRTSRDRPLPDRPDPSAPGHCLPQLDYRGNFGLDHQSSATDSLRPQNDARTRDAHWVMLLASCELDGYARVSGELGVALISRRPGG